MKKINGCIRKHRVWSVIILTVSGVWISFIITYFGEDLNLVKLDLNNKRHLTLLGIISTLIILALIVLITLAQKRADNPDDELLKAQFGLKVLNAISNEFDSLCTNKYNTQLRKIIEIKSGRAFPIDIYSNPDEQLRKISDSIINCLLPLLDKPNHKFNLNDIYVSIAYNFPKENKNEWHWAEVSRDRNPKISELLDNRKSTLSNLIRSGKKNLFFNSKQKAYEQNSYVKDENDEFDKNNKLRGSIACYKMSIKHSGDIYINTIVCITTYRMKFSDNAGTTAIDNVRYNIDEIITDFEKRIGVEMCNVYMRYLYVNDKSLTS